MPSKRARGVAAASVLLFAAGFVFVGTRAWDGGGSPARSTSNAVPAGVDVEVENLPLDAQQQQALHALAGLRNGSAPSASPGEHSGHGGHGNNSASHDHAEGEPSDDLSPETEAELDVARAAAERLMQVSRLSEAGYYINSYYSSGIGTHYIDWRLVDAPFDPAAPAMLLVDTTPGHLRRLAGFSYWVRSADGPPAGFSGESDVWHRHSGLCFVNGVNMRENVPVPAGCDGEWLDGSDLWMLHVWIVPGHENPDGIFAPQNSRLCPPRRGIDAGWC